LLLDFNLEYNPLFPRFIIQTDSVIINTQTILNQKRTMIGGGVGLGGNEDLFKIDLSLGIIDKKNNLYKYSFNPINKTHSVGYMRFFSIGK
jgi:hypothetical protein